MDRKKAYELALAFIVVMVVLPIFITLVAVLITEIW